MRTFLIACLFFIIVAVGFTVSHLQTSANIANNTTAISALEDQTSSLQNATASVNSQISSVEAQVASLTSQLSSANSKISSLESQLSSANSQITSLQSQITSQNTSSTSTQVAGSLTITQSYGQQTLVASFTASTTGYLYVTGYSTSSTGYIYTVNSTYGTSSTYPFNTTTSTVTIPVQAGTVYIYFGNSNTSGTVTANFSSIYYYHY